MESEIDLLKSKKLKKKIPRYVFLAPEKSKYDLVEYYKKKKAK